MPSVVVPSVMEAFSVLGLKCEDLAPGTSERITPGKVVMVHYTGTLQDGTVFDCSRSREPLAVRACRGDVIRGWDVALQHHATVGKRFKLTVPPALGYGSKGKPPKIPGNATLVFDMEVVSVASGAGAAGDLLMDAAATGDVAALRAAIAAGASVEHTDRKGRTALHAAANSAADTSGGAECVARLLELRADVNARATTPAGGTPLLLAANDAKRGQGDLLLMELLMAAGADPSLASYKGNTPLKLAEEAAAVKPGLSCGQARTALLEAMKAVLTCSGPGAAAEPALPSLGIGGAPGFKPKWEAVRCRALHASRTRGANPRCWLRLSCAPKDAPSDANAPPPSFVVELELWADVVPRTAENFRALCTGEKGKSAAFGGPPLHYKGNQVHRIVPGQVLQAGDITSGDGKGGESIYGRKFDDESFDGRAGSHYRKGLLSMANSGRNSNSSQFFITLDAMPHLDGKHVVFGAVTEGMEYVEAVAAAAAGGSGAFDAPSMRVAIEDCGQM